MSEEAFLPVRISTVKPEREIIFDLYIHYKDHYLLYVSKGADINPDKHDKLKKQKIAKFYIRDEDEVNYQTFLDSLLEDTIKDPNVEVDEKINVTEGACETAFERMQDDPGNEQAYKMTQNAAKSLRQIIQDNPNVIKKIFGKKASKEDEIIKHCLNVCAFCTKFGTMLKFSEEELDDIATAALIHDVGIPAMHKDDKALFYKDKSKFTPDDRRLYGFHCKDSAELLSEKPWVNKNVKDLILNHEENRSGTGPNKKTKLTKMEEVLSLVNVYDKKVLVNKKKPKEALKEMMIDEMGNYELDYLNKFKAFLKSEGILE